MTVSKLVRIGTIGSQKGPSFQRSVLLRQLVIGQCHEYASQSSLKLDRLTSKFVDLPHHHLSRDQGDYLIFQINFHT